MHVLVLAPDPVDTETLRGVVGDDIDKARFLVISPALNESPLAFWVSDSDEAIADAEEVGAETVTDLRADGVAANSATGEGKPLSALQDALATFPADQIVIFARAEDEQRYRDEGVCAAAQRRFDVPVTLATL
jgi:hypothetical protein